MAEQKSDQKPAAVAEPAFEFIGTSGTPFNIHGHDFGADEGTVTANGHPVLVTSWNDVRIKGVTPPLKGAVVITVNRAIVDGSATQPQSVTVTL